MIDPTPDSPEAVAQGCKCRTLYGGSSGQGRYGYRFTYDTMPRTFVDPGCPMHGETTRPPE